MSGNWLLSPRLKSRGLCLVTGIALISVLMGCGGDTSDGGDARRTETAQAQSQTDATLTATSVTPTPVQPMSIGDVVWAASIDADTGAPTETVDSFRSDAQIIYAVFPVSNVPADTVITANWTYNDTPLDALSTTITIAPGQAAKWIEFHLSRSDDRWPDGDYAIVIRVDGETIRQADVTIEP